MCRLEDEPWGSVSRWSDTKAEALDSFGLAGVIACLRTLTCLLDLRGPDARFHAGAEQTADR
jgi:hypothetical protein